jgi:hypothetical protein
VARVRDDAVSERQRQAVMVNLLPVVMVAPLVAVMMVVARTVVAVANDVMVPRFVSPSHARPV